MARKASLSAGPNCHAIHSPRHRPSPCSPLKAPLYLRTSARRLLGDGAHLGRAVAPHVEDRPHVQRADRGMGVPGAARAVAREHLGQRVGVVGQVLERHGAVLDEADRLAVALQAHHDVEAGLAHLPQVLLRRVVGHLDHAAGQAEVAHQLDQVAAAARSSAALSSPANSTSRIAVGLADQRRLASSARNAGLASARSIIVRSTSSTARRARA